MVPSPAGTSIVLRGRPSTISASTLVPFSGPSSSAATIIAAVGYSSGGMCSASLPLRDDSHRGGGTRTRGDTELHIQSTPPARCPGLDHLVARRLEVGVARICSADLAAVERTAATVSLVWHVPCARRPSKG